MDDGYLGLVSPARPTSLADQLQLAVWLWGQNLTAQLSAVGDELGETQWTALRTLGRGVAECLPNGDEDRRIILGLLSSIIMGTAPPAGQSAPPSWCPPAGV